MNNQSKSTSSITRRDALLMGAATVASTAIGATVDVRAGEAENATAARANYELLAKSYRVYHYSAFSYDALISVQPSTGYTTSAHLYFRKDGSALPGNSVNAEGTLIHIHFHLSRLDEILSTLRLDGPIWLSMTSSGVFSLSTFSDEPIGEQEL
jgi:hypothetical protein